MDDTFDQTLKKLGERVSQFTSSKATSYSSRLGGISSKVNIKAMLVYGSPFILTIVILFFWKPGFVTEEIEDNEGGYVMKLSFRKLAVSTLIIGSVISALIFLYLRKKEIKL